MNITSETIEFYEKKFAPKNESVKHKNTSDVLAQKKLLNKEREKLNLIQNEHCPYSYNRQNLELIKNWNFDHLKRIEICKKNNKIIREKIKILTQHKR